MREMSRIKAVMDLRAELLRQGDAYCQKHGITRARLGSLVMNDNKFVDRIERGGFTNKTYEKFQWFFSESEAAA